MNLAKIWTIGKDSVRAFFKDDGMSLAAAVAFYTALSFAPLVQLLVTVGGFLGESTQNDLVGFLNEQIGAKAGEVTDAVIESGEERRRDQGAWGWIVSTVLLAISASAVFGQLQHSLNRIWGAAAKPSKNWWAWLRRRLLSLGMVLVILFILLVALVLSAILEWLAPTDGGMIARIGGAVVSYLVAMLLFAAMFKVLPDVAIKWSDVWLGAAITAALFALGKVLVSLYMEQAGVGENYGNAAGALIALLVWVYYSCMIFLIGAEATQAAMRARGGTAPVKTAAEPRRDEEVEKKPVQATASG